MHRNATIFDVYVQETIPVFRLGTAVLQFPHSSTKTSCVTSSTLCFQTEVLVSITSSILTSQILCKCRLNTAQCPYFIIKVNTILICIYFQAPALILDLFTDIVRAAEDNSLLPNGLIVEASSISVGTSTKPSQLILKSIIICFYFMFR